MKKYEGKSIRTIATNAAALPDSFGFSAPKNGHVRRLTASELADQQRQVRRMQRTGGRF